jgi:hypothetical protein
MTTWPTWWQWRIPNTNNNMKHQVTHNDKSDTSNSAIWLEKNDLCKLKIHLRLSMMMCFATFENKNQGPWNGGYYSQFFGIGGVMLTVAIICLPTGYFGQIGAPFAPYFWPYLDQLPRTTKGRESVHGWMLRPHALWFMQTRCDRPSCSEINLLLELSVTRRLGQK